MSGAARVGRFYTAARRHPWVLGRVADWKIPLGPYTPAQIAVAVVGGFLLVKTISWWSVLGPVPVAAWLLAIWAIRRPRIRGRAPLPAALGWVLLGWQPRGGRIGGRAARDRHSRPLLGGFTVEGLPGPVLSAPPFRPAPRRADQAPHSRPDGARSSMSHRRELVAPVAAGVGPVSGVQQLLGRGGQGGGVR
ncbi:hypothetical protein ABZ835_48400 [Streptomyces sp. NPDC047461]|uniref:hypothetical protein n=1 Tax=Streptomyces sp. NPDC047461 TaxID=3155619 RepID=UPI0033CB4C63